MPNPDPDPNQVWLGKGVHVVTPNKKAGSGDLKRWKQCATLVVAVVVARATSSAGSSAPR